jgi:hypothetical protein
MYTDFMTWYWDLPYAKSRGGRRVLSGGIVEILDYKDYAYLNTLEATEQGCGKVILSSICEMADVNNVTIKLHAHSYESENRQLWDDDKLVAWYEQFGFEKVEFVRYEDIHCWIMERKVKHE